MYNGLGVSKKENAQSGVGAGEKVGSFNCRLETKMGKNEKMIPCGYHLVHVSPRWVSSTCVRLNTCEKPALFNGKVGVWNLLGFQLVWKLTHLKLEVQRKSTRDWSSPEGKTFKKEERLEEELAQPSLLWWFLSQGSGVWVFPHCAGWISVSLVGIPCKR